MPKTAENQKEFLYAVIFPHSELLTSDIFNKILVAKLMLAFQILE